MQFNEELSGFYESLHTGKRKHYSRSGYLHIRAGIKKAYSGTTLPEDYRHFSSQGFTVKNAVFLGSLKELKRQGMGTTNISLR